MSPTTKMNRNRTRGVTKRSHDPTVAADGCTETEGDEGGRIERRKSETEEERC